MKLLMTTIAASVLFSGVASAADPYPIIANMSGIISPDARLPDLYGNSYFASGRATGRVPPAPDSTSVTINSNGTSSVTQTYIKH